MKNFKIFGIIMLAFSMMLCVPTVKAVADEGDPGAGNNEAGYYWTSAIYNDQMAQGKVTGLPSYVLVEAGRDILWDQVKINVYVKLKDGTETTTTDSLRRYWGDKDNDFNGGIVRIWADSSKGDLIDSDGKLVSGGSNYKWIVEYADNTSETIPFELKTISSLQNVLNSGSTGLYPSGKNKFGYDFLCVNIPSTGSYIFNIETGNNLDTITNLTMLAGNGKKSYNAQATFNKGDGHKVIFEGSGELDPQEIPSNYDDIPQISKGYYFLINTEAIDIKNCRISFSGMSPYNEIKSMELDPYTTNNIYIADSGKYQIESVAPNRITAKVVNSNGRETIQHFRPVYSDMTYLDKTPFLVSEESSIVLKYYMKTSDGQTVTTVDYDESNPTRRALTPGAYKWEVLSLDDSPVANLSFAVVAKKDALTQNYIANIGIDSDLSKYTLQDISVKLIVPEDKSYELSMIDPTEEGAYLKVYASTLYAGHEITVDYLGWNDNKSLLLPTGTYALVGCLSHYKLATDTPQTPTLSSARLVDEEARIIEVEWVSNSKAQSYELYRSVNGGDYSLLAQVTAPERKYRDEGLERGSRYSYKLVAVNKFGKSDFSNPKEAYVVQGKPGVPSIYSARQADGEIIVVWREAVGASGYELQRSINDGQFETLAYVENGRTSYSEKIKITVNEKHTYRVKAYNRDQYSAYSQTVSVVINGKIATPVMTEAVFNGTSVMLKWEKTKNAEGYYVYRSENGGAYEFLTYLDDCNETTFENASISYGCQYSYKVKAISTTYISKFSNVVTATSINPVEINAINGRCEKAVIEWSEDEGADSYNIYRKDAANAYTLIANVADATSYTDTTVTNKTEYTYKVAARVGSNEGLSSEEKAVTISGHSNEKNITPATTSENGKIVSTCKRCGKKTTSKIYAASNISLAYVNTSYTGSARKPAVTVLDSRKKTVSSSYYQVTYSNNKEVGKATVKITFRDNYTGSVKLKFNINPAPCKIASLSTTSREMTVNIKAGAGMDGYEIMYADDSKYSKAKTLKVKGSAAKTIKKLTSGVKYYIKVRSYKTVKEGSRNVTYYSDWSSSKTIKVN